MRRIILLCFVVTSLFAQSYGTGPTVTWYQDTAHTIPALGKLQSGVMEGQKLYGVLSTTATAATMYGHSVGSIVLTNSNHTQIVSSGSYATYTAPNTITPVHSVNGLQPLPNDDIFFTPIYNLPLRTDQGDPIQGTGRYTTIEPTASFLNANNYQTCTPNTAGSTNGCHIITPANSFSYATTTTATILQNPIPPSTWFLKSVYGQQTGYQPDVRGTFVENHQGGNYHIPLQACNLKNPDGTNSIEDPVPPFPNCYDNGGGSPDMHEFMVDPINLTNYESYADTTRSGVFANCLGVNPASKTCTASSWRQIDWSDHRAVGGMGDAGTPENALELIPDDLYKAHDGIPISHVFAYTLKPGYQFKGYRWPAVGDAAGNTDTYGPMDGSRMRFTHTRYDQTGASDITVTNAGVGYPAGTVITFPIPNCTSIDGSNQASGIAFVGTNGQIENNGHYYIGVTNTGKNCPASQTVTLPTPSGGTAAVVTVSANFPGSVNNPWPDNNVGVQLVAQAQNFGWELDDIGTGPQMRVDADIYNNPYFSTFSDFFTSGTNNTYNGYHNPYLWEEVDESTLATTAWGSGAGTNLWAADSANTYEGSQVPLQAVVQLTSSGGNSFNPVSLLGVAVGIEVGNQSNRINIMSGMTAYQMTPYVTGDPTNAGVTWSMATDPCPGDSSESLTANGVYTPCSVFNGSALKTGLFKLASKANPAAYVYVEVNVIPTDGINLRIDSGGGGGCTGSASSGGTCTNGVWYSADVGWKMNDQPYKRSYGSCGYPGNWNNVSFPAPFAPMATAGELGLTATKSCIYLTTNQDNDVTYTLIVPNGNYQVRNMFARSPGGTGSGVTSTPLGGYDWLYNIDTQGSMKLYSYCWLCVNHDETQTPTDVMVPAKVTNNVLELGLRGVYMSRWQTTSPQDAGATSQEAIVSGINVLLDTSTSPYWSIHAYTPNDDVNAMDANNTWIFPLNNGATDTTDGAVPPGVYQLYVEDFFTGVDDPAWSIVSGPGSLSTSGLFVSPTTQPPGGTCTVVQAKSQSTTYVATQQICYSGASAYAFH